MISGAYAQEYGQAEEMEKALQKVQVSECTPEIRIPLKLKGRFSFQKLLLGKVS